MDIQKIIQDLIGKFTSDTSLLDKFKKDPTNTIKSLVGSELNEADLSKIVSEVKSGIGSADSNVLGGLADEAKKLFGK